MNSLLELLVWAMVAWRVTICFLGSLVLAIAVSNIAPAVGGPLSLMLVLPATAFGIYWHAQADAGLGMFEKSTPEQAESGRLSAPVACLCFIFAGFFWGVVFVRTDEAILFAAAAMLLSSIPLVAWQRWVLAKVLSWRYLVFSYFSAYLGFAVGGIWWPR